MSTNKLAKDDTLQQVVAAIQGISTVVANPTLAGGETSLTGLQVAGTKYKVASQIVINRFLTFLDCDAKTVESMPTTLPYSYKTGDYFIVKTGGAFKPKDGVTSIPAGATNIEWESSGSTTSAAGDIWLFDGTNWLYRESAQVMFSQIGGVPGDNAALGAVLNPVEFLESEYDAGTIDIVKYSKLESADKIKGVKFNGSYFPVLLYKALKSGSSYVFIGQFNIDDAFFKVSVKIASTYALSVEYTGGKLTDLERVEVEAVLDASYLPKYRWNASLTTAIFNKMKNGRALLDISLVTSAGATPTYFASLNDYYYITAWNAFAGTLIIDKGVATADKCSISVVVSKDASSNVTLTAEVESPVLKQDDLQLSVNSDGKLCITYETA